MELPVNQTIYGKNIPVMSEWPDNCIDSIVTDPPYGLRFMGKKWDYNVPSVETWRECLRVLKPGGHLLSFAGTRTQHRMAINIEDAGFEIRDMILWIYGSGFPKSLDVGKAIDKSMGAKREKILIPTKKGNLPEQAGEIALGANGMTDISIPVSSEAQAWDGWGTALKPACEPITMARKPLIGTVAETVLKYGAGGININGCLVEYSDDNQPIPQIRNGNTKINSEKSMFCGNSYNESATKSCIGGTPDGRWPANVIHDGSDDVVDWFPVTAGQNGRVGPEFGNKKSVNVYGNYGPSPVCEPRNDSGSAARFFYVAKPSKAERGDGNNHPMVKPLALIRYLVRLVTPPGGIVLDPFAGSGTTAGACIEEGFNYILIEMEEEYIPIINARVNAWKSQGRLF